MVVAPAGAVGVVLGAGGVMGAAGPLISDAIRRSARARREAAMVTVDRLFALLELRPRVPVQLLADVIVAFIDGLAIHASIAPQANHRVAFDVLWLSLLSLAE